MPIIDFIFKKTSTKANNIDHDNHLPPQQAPQHDSEHAIVSEPGVKITIKH